MLNQLTYKPYGDSAILIEWKPEISEEILLDILSYKTKIKGKLELQDVIIGYNSLLIVYPFQLKDYLSKVEFLKELYSSSEYHIKLERNHWSIPVCYDEQFGLDLRTLSKDKKMSVEEVIKLHTTPTYMVHFIGFLPGFLYLGGMDAKITTPRKATPRLQVPKGAVGIGGSQTGIYPNESAGGWNLIGNSPISFFDIDKTKPCFANIGDKISFKQISLEEHSYINEQVFKGIYQIEKKI